MQQQSPRARQPILLDLTPRPPQANRQPRGAGKPSPSVHAVTEPSDSGVETSGIQEAPDKWVSIKDAAAYFDCSASTISKGADEMSLMGRPGIRRLGKSSRRVNLLAMDRFLRDRDRQAVIARTPLYEDPSDTLTGHNTVVTKISKSW